MVGGLSTAEAAARLKRFGYNDPNPAEGHHRLRIFLLFISNPLVVILLLASVASYALGEHTNGAIILSLVLLSVSLDLLQNVRSNAAVKLLQADIVPQAQVLRNSEWIAVPRRQLVPGDLIHLVAGDLVPADCRLVEEQDLHVQEAALTGESLPIGKVVGTGTDEAKVFLGSAVVSGTATAVVEETGPLTRFGQIVGSLRKRPPQTEFEHGLRRFGLLIMRLVIFLILFATTAMILMHRDPFQSLLFGVALAVGLTPEFLPMITTLTLSKGAVRMAKHKVIVKNLASIQNFGSMDILCSDKTGTLTSGVMTLEKTLDSKGVDSKEVGRLGHLNAVFQSGIPTPLDAAILKELDSDRQSFQKIDEIPFDFERRRVSVVVERDGVRQLICKGAPEGVLATCSGQYQSELGLINGYGAEGYRVLAVASRRIDVQDSYGKADETGLQLKGFLIFADPPLPGVLDVLHRLQGAGLAVKIITGDSEAVASHVCASIGLKAGNILQGEAIDKMTDAALGALAEQTTVFARVNPAQKNRIILALKSRGHVVGYMGDGINDAPALHTADVGISFASGTDVAKDAAQIILLERSLELLHKGVLEGRMAFGNLMKYLLMGTSSNFGNMFSMAGAALFLNFLPMLPVQILLNNLLYDVAQITIPTDHVDPSFIRKPKRWDIAVVRDFMIWIGPISSLFDALTFWALLSLFRADEKLFHTGWFVESLATQVLVIFIIRTRNDPWKSKPSSALVYTTLAVVAAGLILPFTGIGRLVGLVPLPAAYYLLLVPTIAVYLFLVDKVKKGLMNRAPA